MPKNPDDFVQAHARDGSLVHVARRTAKAFKLKINEGRPALDGFGNALPRKKKRDLSKPAAKVEPKTESKPESKPDTKKQEN